jgi:hypothetical protein
MQILSATHKIDSYIDVSVTDSRYDDIDNASITFVANYMVDASAEGLTFDVHEITDINLSYTGVNFTEEEDESHPISFTVLDFAKEVHIDNAGGDRQYLSPNEVEVNIDERKISFYFSY